MQQKLYPIDHTNKKKLSPIYDTHKYSLIKSVSYISHTKQLNNHTQNEKTALPP